MIRDRRMLDLAIRAGLATPEEIELWTRGPDPDPLEHLSAEQRIDWCIRHAGSGIWSECPPAYVEIDGRCVLVPPGHRPAPCTNHAQRSEKRRNP